MEAINPTAALQEILDSVPEFKALFEHDEMVRSFVECLVSQANGADRVLHSIGETAEQREYVIQVIAQWIANTWRSEYPNDSSAIN